MGAEGNSREIWTRPGIKIRPRSLPTKSFDKEEGKMMKKPLRLAMLALIILLTGCVGTNSSIKESQKTELKILEVRIEPIPPKLEKEVYLVLRYQTPGGNLLKACVRYEVLVPKQTAGPYSLEKVFEQELIAAEEPKEVYISLGKFHSSRGNLPVRVEVYLKDKDGNRGQTKSIDFYVQP
jgi:hypothetical protein